MEQVNQLLYDQILLDKDAQLLVQKFARIQNNQETADYYLNKLVDHLQVWANEGYTLPRLTFYFKYCILLYLCLFEFEKRYVGSLTVHDKYYNLNLTCNDSWVDVVAGAAFYFYNVDEKEKRTDIYIAPKKLDQLHPLIDIQPLSLELEVSVVKDVLKSAGYSNYTMEIKDINKGGMEKLLGE